MDLLFREQRPHPHTSTLNRTIAAAQMQNSTGARGVNEISRQFHIIRKRRLVTIVCSPTHGLAQNRRWYSMHSNSSLKSPAVPEHAQLVRRLVPRISTMASRHAGYGAAQVFVSASAEQDCSYLHTIQ